MWRAVKPKQLQAQVAVEPGHRSLTVGRMWVPDKVQPARLFSGDFAPIGGGVCPQYAIRSAFTTPRCVSSGEVVKQATAFPSCTQGPSGLGCLQCLALFQVAPNAEIAPGHGLHYRYESALTEGASLQVDREGRGLTRRQRVAIWKVLEASAQAIAAASREGWSDAVRRACHLIAPRRIVLPKTYRAVIVDEVQDMGTPEMRFRLSLVGSHPRRRFWRSA